MKARVNRLGLWRALMGFTLLVLAGCGGGGGSGGSSPTTGTSLAANVQELVVDSGPAGMTTRVVNTAYTSVRICVPGTNNCQTIDHVLVDTGSTGLRLLASALTLPLPQQLVASNPLYNCIQFIDRSYVWGSVAQADLYMGGTALDGRKAANLPIQLISAGAPSVTCTSNGSGMARSTVDSLGANGILGVSPYLQDCGSICTTNSGNGTYYVNTGSSNYAGTTASLAAQLQQPVSKMPQDNNGVVISLPAVAGSASSLSGTLTLGIATQSNNQLGSASVLGLDASGYFTTDLSGSFSALGLLGFLDTGSNGLFFGMPSPVYCTGSTSWYCPSTARTIQATNTGTNSQSISANFTVQDVNALLTTASVSAIEALSGPAPSGLGATGYFDFGLPFFYGRKVFTAIQNGIPIGVYTTPFVAY